MKLSFVLITFLFGNIFSQSCPLRCPSCTKCDPKKGTCTEARDFVTCTRNSVSGVCFAGMCNTKLKLSVSLASNRCQTYRCPVAGVCNVITAPDGTDCTPLNVAYESVCLSGTCQRVWLGLGEEMPFQNTGCVGKPNGAVCDTNHILSDGETCQNGVCRFPDGTYYGYVNVPVVPPV